MPQPAPVTNGQRLVSGSIFSSTIGIFWSRVTVGSVYFSRNSVESSLSACFMRKTSYGVSTIATSRQQLVKQSSPLWHANGKASSGPIAGRSVGGASRVSKSSAMGKLRSRDDMLFERLLGPYRQWTAFPGYRIEPEPVGGMHLILALHPLPATHEVGAIVVEADVLEFAAPGAQRRRGPSLQRAVAMRALDASFLGHRCNLARSGRLLCGSLPVP